MDKQKRPALDTALDVRCWFPVLSAAFAAAVLVVTASASSLRVYLVNIELQNGKRGGSNRLSERVDGESLSLYAPVSPDFKTSLAAGCFRFTCQELVIFPLGDRDRRPHGQRKDGEEENELNSGGSARPRSLAV